MKPISAIIVDDEENNCINLQNLLARFCPIVDIKGYAQSALDGFELIKKHAPTLLFLDIEMPCGSGFDLLEMVKGYYFELIFVTAFDQYAIQAIRMSAIDYLLKPISVNELQNAINKVVVKLGKQESHNVFFQNYIENHGISGQERKIALVSAERHLFVKVKEIIRFEGENNYTYVFLLNGEKVLVSRTLKDFEELLDDSGFIRVHQSHVINMDHIRSFEKRDGGHIQMSDKSVVHISRQRKEKVLKALQGWRF